MLAIVGKSCIRFCLAAVLVLFCGCQQAGFSLVSDPPQVKTLSASVVTSTSCTLNGEINPNGFATNGWFEWGTDPQGTLTTTPAS